MIISYDDPQRRPVLDLVRQIKRQRRMILDDNEAYQIAMAVRKTQKISGDLAEVGVFQGGSAKLICESNCGKPLHLFDTFEGIPKVEEIDTPAFYKGQFAASLEDVQTYLKGYIQIYFYKGLFPETGKPVEEKKILFRSLRRGYLRKHAGLHTILLSANEPRRDHSFTRLHQSLRR